MSITQEQFEALEAAHGKNQVLVLSIGKDEFAFRRPNQIDADYALSDKDKGNLSWMEAALLSCALCPTKPTENKAPTEGKAKYTRPECPELVEICSQIEAIWKEAPLCSDTLPLVWLQSCGYGTQIDSKKIGAGLYEVTVSSNPNLGADEWSYTLKARSLAKPQYEKLRKLQMEEDYAAEKYAFDVGVTEIAGISKAEFKSLYPFAPIGIGTLIRTLGAEARGVSVKKFGAGSAQQPTSSIEKPPLG